MVKLLQNQALNTTLARQYNLGYASSPKYLIFPALSAGRLYFNPSLQNSNDHSGFNIDSGITNNFLAMELKHALSALSEITGKGISTEDLLENIFSKFCIGK